jgi:hypothetical protein
VGWSGGGSDTDFVLADFVGTGAGLAITITPTTIAATLGTLSVSLPWTPTDATSPSTDVSAEFRIDGLLTNDPNEDDPDKCADSPDSAYNAQVWALRVSTDLGNCIVVPHCDTSIPFSTGPYGAGCEVATRVSDTLFTTSQPFVPNSTSVYASGLLQRRGVDYTEGSDAQSFTFTSSVVEMTSIRVCYTAATLS